MKSWPSITAVIPSFSCCRLCFSVNKGDKAPGCRTDPYNLRLTQEAGHLSSYAQRSDGCAFLGDSAVPTNCRSSLAEVNALAPAHMCEQKQVKTWLGSTAHSGCIAALSSQQDQPSAQQVTSCTPMKIIAGIPLSHHVLLRERTISQMFPTPTAFTTWEHSSSPLKLLKLHRQRGKQPQHVLSVIKYSYLQKAINQQISVLSRNRHFLCYHTVLVSDLRDMLHAPIKSKILFQVLYK